jgi:DNA polymerase-3 subunit alpha
MHEFIHLHNHSHYSLLDGAATVSAIVNATVQQKMPAVALTDHGVLFGALEFYKKANKAGIKPIIGCEAYIVTKGSRKERVAQPSQDSKAKGRGVYHHILLLAKSEPGYKNLMKLVSLSHIEGFYYKPRIDLELLSQYKEGLVATSACPGGIISPYLLANEYDKAKEIAGTYKDLFGEDFYIEIQDHGTPDDRIILSTAPRLAKELGIKLVATNDCHYIGPDDHLYHNIMLMIPDASNGVTQNYMELRYGTKELYFKSAEAMCSLFSDFPEAIQSTLEIAEKCNVHFEKKNQMPKFPIPPDSGVTTFNEYLEKLTFEGIAKKYPALSPEIKARADYELDVIKKMDFAGYFLIVQDFIRRGREMGVRVGPGRGSAAGSIVAFALDITEIDPLKYNLLFERFLNSERISMPDIDVDFADDKRELVIGYVREKYGADSVAQIVTFGTMSSRAVLKDVGRVLGIPHTLINTYTKNIQIELGKPMPLHEAIQKVTELRDLRNSSDEKIRLLVDASLALEGLNKNVSTHAAGVVITPGNIADYVPLYVTPSTEIMTQYNMKDLEDAGLLKIDFLGLRTLTVIENALELIKKNHGVVIDLRTIPEKDPKALELFAQGQTIALFQFTSSGMQDYLRKLKPTCIEDLVAMNALYRPGPMNMIPDFIACKHGKKEIKYLHPALEPILKETYGVIVYQEQVMQITNAIGGFSLAKADLLRRAMGKKDKDLMARQKNEFIEGAIRNNVDKRIAGEIFDLIERFASYGFNKSHSVAYAVLAYQTAFLKAHYPAEFMAATLTSEMDDTDEIVVLIDECQKMGIGVFPPDINESHVNFVVTQRGIRFGLSALKGVGVGAVEEMVRAREEKGNFIDLFDFCSRVDLHTVNKRSLESLIQAGAFDSLHDNRAQLFIVIERAMAYGQNVRDALRKGQGGLFDTSSTKIQTRPMLPQTEKWTEREKLNREKAVLGFYVSGHPLKRYELEVESFATAKFGDASRVKKDAPVKVCGIITNIKKAIDKKNEQYAFVTLEDYTGKGDCIVFSRQYKEFSPLLVVDALVMVEGKAEPGEGSLRILANKVYRLSEVREKFTKTVTLYIDVATLDDGGITRIRQTLERYPGTCDCNLVVYSGSLENKLVYSLPRYEVMPNDEFFAEMKNISAITTVRLSS